MKVGEARNFHTLSNLQKALDTFRERNKCYGDNYKAIFGNVMQALFPNGVRIEGVEQWSRFGVFIQIVSKLTRYVADPHTGHHDSAHDMGVYAFMLEEIDSMIAGLDTSNPDVVRVEITKVRVNPRDCEHIWQTVNGERVCRVCDIPKKDWEEAYV